MLLSTVVLLGEAQTLTADAGSGVGAPVAAVREFTTNKNVWLGAAAVQLNAGWRIESTAVRTLWVDCPTPWVLLGARVRVTWCGTWNNGGSPVDAGVNFTYELSTPGGWVYYARSGYIRTRVWSDGWRQDIVGY